MKRYEKMAKLNLPESERQVLNRRAESLLHSFRALEQVETDDVLPLVSVLDRQTVLREDMAKKTITREELLAGAPEQYGAYFQVPKTIE